MSKDPSTQDKLDRVGYAKDILCRVCESNLSDHLLIGWVQIWKALFHDKDGNPVIELDTLKRKYGPEFKEYGVIMDWTLGRGKERKIRNIVGWHSVIQNYFIRKYQWIYQKQKMKEESPSGGELEGDKED